MHAAAADEPFSQHLNAPQAAAALHVDGPILVFAGAGSGKTRVITFRVANLVATHHVPPYRILAVTFTNKAAGEMRARLGKLLGEDVARDLWVGTFHATCARLLRRFHAAAGLGKDFVIYDDGDQRAVVARVLKELELDDRSFPPKQVLSRIHALKQEGKQPADAARSSFTDEVVARVFEGYERHLLASNAVDFDDLLLHVMRAAESETAIGEELRDRFDYVLVDEFQDTNMVQYRLVRALASKHHNLCVVGDDDQSIYRWRGGDVRIIRGYKRDFPEALVVKLEENYRSTGRIVRAALGVIAPSNEREPKELFTRNHDGAKVAVVTVRDERDEAAYVVRKVRETIASGVEASEVAVFYRVHAMSRVLEEALRSENLPYRIVGGTRFFDRAEVKDVLAYLRVALNPRSDVDLLRVINVPTRGIGDTTVERLLEVATLRGTSVYDALELTSHAPSIAAAAQKKLASLRDMLDGFRAGAQTMRPSELALRVIDETGYRKALEKEDTAEADARLENLAELVGSMRDVETELAAAGVDANLAAYLERVTLSTNADEQKDGPRVSLMTVHSAKGLEFHTVLITGMEEEMFPYVRRGEEAGSDDEEERRLAYVAITRARTRLHLTTASLRTLFGNTRYGVPSRFLADLPPADVELVGTPAARGGSPYGDSTRASAPPPWSRPSFSAPRTAPPSHRRPAPPPERAPGERWVEREPEDGAPLGRGSRVKHTRFGEGTVVRFEPGADPAAYVHFPGWGEKKILARFLELALAARRAATPCPRSPRRAGHRRRRTRSEGGPCGSTRGSAGRDARRART